MQNWLLKQAELKPQHTALITPREHFTFAQLATKVRQCAAHLKQLTQPDTTVAVLGGNTVAMYCTILAAQMLQRPLVCLNWRLSAATLKLESRLAAVQLVLVDDELTNLAADNAAKITALAHDVSIEKMSTLMQPATPLPVADVPAVNFDATASIMFTSGTSGTPKGVIQTFGNHFFSATSSAFNLGVLATDNWLCTVPLFHISGLSIMQRSLIYGMTVTLLPRFDATSVATLLKSTHLPFTASQPLPAITITSVVPVMLQALLDQPDLQLNAAFRCFLLGGGALSEFALTQCAHRNWQVIQSYGMTETCSQVVALSFADAPNKIGSVGKPLLSVEMKLMPPNNEIWLKAPNIAPRYLDRPTLDADGWFNTHDIGYRDADGFWYIRGRSGDLINSGGEKFFPKEVEQAFAPLKIDLVVTSFPDAKWGQVPVGFLRKETVARHHLTAAELSAYGRAHLAHYQVPTRFWLVDEFPKTASGKVQRGELQRLAPCLEQLK